MSFDKILIANRGEIACRVIDTADRMGISTVAVYSDADAGARHVEMADEAVRIGPDPVAESYLQGERIIEAALETGAQAIHPGYGFLSENPDFVDAVEQAGLTFIGPSAEAIRAMGLKDNAKRLMEVAGVPVVPGYHGADQDPEILAAKATDIGYPVLIKARAGGGGKGMRYVDAPGAFGSALEGAMREAQSSFGDPACLIEKFITQPRHIEIQVLGDSHGNVVHLFERDCSLQRRHQKVIEEAPAPDMPQAVRDAMGRAAVDAAKAINYQGAGTVEFIVDASNGLKPIGFWFMEMNTRLQVEHPVTEAITGLDLVELQLKIAAGEKLAFGQNDLKIDGHAFEARIYAEDVRAGFLPSTGQLDHVSFSQDARIDTGIRQGDEITPYYDPMIAKLTVHGTNRPNALARLRHALEKTEVAGAKTNLRFLHALASHNGFCAGEVDTGLIERDIDMLTRQPAPPSEVLLTAALAHYTIPEDPFQSFRHWSDAHLYLDLVMAEEEFPCELQRSAHGRYRFNDAEWSVARKGSSFSVTSNGRTYKLRAISSQGETSVYYQGCSYTFRAPVVGQSEEQSTSDTVSAPMPGLVKDVSVASGQEVAEGAPLLILEAMKMEHVLTAPRAGKIAQVLTQNGAQVDANAVLIKLESQDD